MRKRIDHYCSVVPEKSQNSPPPFSGKLRKLRFPLECLALRLGYCLSPLNTIDVFYLSHTPVPARWKDKTNSRTSAARRSVTSLNVKMTPPCHISAYSGFSNDTCMSHLSVFRTFRKHFSCFPRMKSGI